MPYTQQHAISFELAHPESGIGGTLLWGWWIKAGFVEEDVSGGDRERMGLAGRTHW